MKRVLTAENVSKAKETFDLLMSFTNKEISEINDDKPVNDRNRMQVILFLIAEEFGDAAIYKLKVDLKGANIR